MERARRLMNNWQKFYFSQQDLYKRGRDLNIKTLWPSYNLSVFASLYFHCQCPWLSINFFPVKGNHLAFLPTMIETWCTCRFWPCQNDTKPQWPCQTVAFGSQRLLSSMFFNWTWRRSTFNLMSWYVPIQQMTGNKHRISEIRKAISSIIQNECLKGL
jgi:hypothetical protein